MPRAGIFGDLITTDYKILSEGSESRWYKFWQLSGNNPTHVNKNDPEEPSEVPGADGETQSHLH